MANSTTTIHILAPFHTKLSDEFSHCAFTGKARRIPAMMRPFERYRTVMYCNAGSDTDADVVRNMLSESEYKGFFPKATTSPGQYANVQLPGAQLFRQRLEAALHQEAGPGDIVAHIWEAHADLVHRFPGLIHVETGIGYPGVIPGAYRIFESNAWMHFHLGRICSPGGVFPHDGVGVNPARTWVVPNYFIEDDWTFVKTPQTMPPYIVFMSRFCVDKGIAMLAKVIKAWQARHPDTDLRFAIAGMGEYESWITSNDFSPEELARIDYKGVVTGTDRAKLLGNALGMILPSTFVEPFGGAAVEAMLCGTPAITSDIGAFTETIKDGVTGFRCRTVDDYVNAIGSIGDLDREYVSGVARSRYTLRACGQKYDKIFQTLVTSPAME